MPPEVLTAAEAADYLRLSEVTLKRFRASGRGPRFARFGAAVRYRRTDLDDYIASSLVASRAGSDDA